MPANRAETIKATMDVLYTAWVTTIVCTPRLMFRLTKYSNEAIAMTISGVMIVIYTNPSKPTRNQRGAERIPSAASVPSETATAALSNATVRLIWSALVTSGLFQAAWYHLVVKPPQIVTLRESLN